MFEFTGPMDPNTVDGSSVELWRLGDAPRRIEADVVLMEDRMHALVTAKTLPLDEGADYAVVVRRAVRDALGGEAVAMPVGHFLKATAPVFRDGASQVGAVASDDAERLERTRLRVAGLLDAIGRHDVLAAWPFRTMTIRRTLEDDVRLAATLGVSPHPKNVVRQTPAQALAEFPLAISSLLEVGAVYHGTIESPVFLDRRTREWRQDGGHEVEDIAFTMVVPRNPPPGPRPVVIFGHAIMTERRFVLALGNALAARGFVAVSIDFPLHGTRAHCYHGGPLSLIDPMTGELSSLEPCQPGTTCAEDGRCVDENGQGNALARWPILDMPVASGAAFIEVDHIARTKDHFRQAVIDLGALSRSLREGDWETVIGMPLRRDRLYYAGQSLGGIIGATFVPLSPEIPRAVLNVAGANTVDLFCDSPFFGPHVDAFFRREKVEEGSFEAERFLNVARWFMDAVDPQNVAASMTDRRDVLVQMALLDTIIPNAYTELLVKLAGVPKKDYLAEHAFLVIPVEPEYLRGVNDLADFLAAPGVQP